MHNAMERILFLNYCSVPIFAIILVTTYIRRTTKGLANRLFLSVTFVSLLTVTADIIAEWINMEPQILHDHPWTYIFPFLYFSLRGATIWMYLLFIIAYFRMTFQFRSKFKRFLIGIPYFVMIAVLFTNPIHNLMFTVTEETGYQRGPLFFFTYLSALFYAIFGMVFLLRYIRYVAFDKWMALFSMYLLTFLAVGLQMLFPRVLIEMYTTSLVCLIISQLVLRPEEITDASTGLGSWAAYKNELKKITEICQPIQIIAYRFLNAGQVRAYLGEELYSKYIRCIADGIGHFCELQKVHWELYYETPMGLYLVLDEKTEDWDAASAMPQLYAPTQAITSEVDESGVRLEGKLCVIHFPEDLESGEDILRLGHDFYGLISYEEKWVAASDIIGTRRYQIENQMDTILNRAIREQRFEMYYQPIFNMKEQRFVSCEALIRLHDELFGQISPGIFIPAAESKGLILPVGEFVLESVFQFISENNVEALDISFVEINLSVAQLMQHDLPDLIRYLQEKYRVQPRQVVFEIVETTYDEIGQLADRNIRTLAGMGYRFALDDYGTGYSNIQRVSTLPFEIIKIDKSLTDTLDEKMSSSIFSNVVHMMKDIGKEIVIEGIEEEEQVESLKELDCEYIQGFVFAKPMPVADFLEFIRTKRREKKH